MKFLAYLLRLGRATAVGHPAVYVAPVRGECVIHPEDYPCEWNRTAVEPDPPGPAPAEGGGGTAPATPRIST